MTRDGIGAPEIARLLGERIEQLVPELLPGGRREGRTWRCGSVAGEPGASLAVELAGPKRGVWIDHANPDHRGDALDLVRLSLDVSTAEAMAWARRWLGLEDGVPARNPAPVRRREANERDWSQRIALDLWRHKTAPAAGTVVETYWRSRGLGELAIPSTIRISRFDLRHPEGGCRPCMVALVEHAERGAVAVHRTFLAFDGSGKASFRAPRLSLGPVGGAAVRLAGAGETLLVAEGLETAASVMLATGLPAWAALSAGGIERLLLPPLPAASTVIVAADHDRNGVGERAAWTAAQRWRAEGRHVRIALPPAPGSDFNDLLNMREARHVAAA